MGLFTHTYHFRFKVALSDGSLVKGKCPIEARFMTPEEIIHQVKIWVENELFFKTSEHVVKWFELYELGSQQWYDPNTMKKSYKL